MTTLSQLMQEVQHSKSKQKIYYMLAEFLTLRYTKNDTGNIPHQVATDDGTPVSEAVIYEVIEELEGVAKENAMIAHNLETEEIE